MQKNLFDVISPKMLNIFAREDRRSNYDLLKFIYDLLSLPEYRIGIARDELVDLLTSYIRGRDFDYFEDEDGQPFERTAKERALLKIRQFTKTGWLEEDNGEGFTRIVTLSDNALLLMKDFDEIIASKDHPLEYTGYFYTIYSLLVNFDYSKTKAILEQINRNTRSLFDALQGLTSSIKGFIQTLLTSQSSSPNDVLDLLLNKYQKQVVLTVFNNLKGKDNPSKYTSFILDKLRELRFNSIDKLVDNYISSDQSINLNADTYQEVENEIINILDNTINNFSTVDEFVHLIDQKNAKFHKNVVAKLIFLLNSRKDLEGQLVKALRALKEGDAGHHYDEVIPIFYSDNIDERSTYSRSFNKERIRYLPMEDIEISEEEINESLRRIALDDSFSRKKISSYVLNCLGDKNEISSKDIEIKDFKDFIKVIAIQLYSEYQDVPYKVTFLDNKYSTFGYVMQEYIIERK